MSSKHHTPEATKYTVPADWRRLNPFQEPHLDSWQAAPAKPHKPSRWRKVYVSKDLAVGPRNCYRPFHYIT